MRKVHRLPLRRPTHSWYCGIALCWIVAISKKRHINPYKQDVFVDQQYYKDAMARADMS